MVPGAWILVTGARTRADRRAAAVQGLRFGQVAQVRSADPPFEPA